jgi:hypothetical protein
MTPAMIGLTAGAVVAIANYLLLGAIAAKQANPRSRSIIKAVALMDIAVMPAAGWAIGKFVFESAV